MKKIIAFLTLIWAFSPVDSQTYDKLASIIALSNDKCPVAINDACVLQGVILSDSSICYYLQIDPEKVQFGEMKKKEQLFYDCKAMELATDSGPEALRPYCLYNNLNVVYKFLCGNDSIEITVTPSDME